MTQEPSVEAMRFVVKLHQPLGLGAFGCKILAKAFDEARAPDPAVAGLVEALRLIASQPAETILNVDTGKVRRIPESEHLVFVQRVARQALKAWSAQ